MANKTTKNTHLTQCRFRRRKQGLVESARAINYESKNNHVQSMVVYHLSTTAAATMPRRSWSHTTCAWACAYADTFEAPKKNEFCAGNLFINFQRQAIKACNKAQQ